MLNTRASINKAVEALNLSPSLLFDDYQSLRPGTGPYPAIAVRVLDDQRQRPIHFSRRTPRSPIGAHRETLVVECEVRTRSRTWNEAVYYAGLIRDALDEKTIARRSWLLDLDSINLAPASAGFIMFGPSALTTLEAEDQPEYKSAFLTWEVQVEVPIS